MAGGRKRMGSLWWVSILGLLVACSGRQIHPTAEVLGESSRDSSEAVLVLKFFPDGQVEQSWQPASAWSRELGRFRTTVRPDSGQVMFAAGRPRDCDQEQIDCHRECMRRRPPYSYAKKGSREHVQHCDEMCLKYYMDCLKAEGLLPLKSEATVPTANWLKENQEALMAGGIVLVAGTAFVVLFFGPELLVLAPLVLVP